ncbi:MAG: hypothetical protein SWK76_07620 [Actinomycetota bacterium]|nr:hypothetical protein [Actinomycetota bacterium]
MQAKGVFEVALAELDLSMVMGLVYSSDRLNPNRYSHLGSYPESEPLTWMRGGYFSKVFWCFVLIEDMMGKVTSLRMAKLCSSLGSRKIWKSLP